MTGVTICRLHRHKREQSEKPKQDSTRRLLYRLLIVNKRLYRTGAHITMPKLFSNMYFLRYYARQAGGYMSGHRKACRVSRYVYIKTPRCMRGVFAYCNIGFVSPPCRNVLSTARRTSGRTHTARLVAVYVISKGLRYIPRSE